MREITAARESQQQGNRSSEVAAWRDVREVAKGARADARISRHESKDRLESGLERKKRKEARADAK